jgi:hypothetical protein
MSLVVLDSAVASRRANGGARRVGIVGLAVLAGVALGADPVANAASVPGCPLAEEKTRKPVLITLGYRVFGDRSWTRPSP